MALLDLETLQSPWKTLQSYCTSFLLSLSLLLLFLICLQRVLRVPNRVERRLRHFLHILASHPTVSHRGGYPENTLSGIRLVKKKGYRAVEVDVEFTRDDCPVLLHDSTVDRTSNGTGCIRDMTLAQACQLDFGIKFGSQYAGEKIPTLQEAVALCRELGLIIIVDIKGNRWRTARLLQQMSSQDPELCNHLIVISFYPDLIYLVAKMNPDFVCASVMKDWEFTWSMESSVKPKSCWRQVLTTLILILVSFINYHVLWRLVELPFVGIYKKDLTDEKLEFWRKRGATVIVWTMREKEAENFQENCQVPVIVDIAPPE